MKSTTRCPEKRDRYFGRNFDKFRPIFTIFGTNHPDILNICTTVSLRNDDVIVTSLKNAVFVRRNIIQNSFRLYCGLQIRHICIQLTTVCGAYRYYERRVTDVDDLKHRIRS